MYNGACVSNSSLENVWSISSFIYKLLAKHPGVAREKKIEKKFWKNFFFEKQIFEFF